MERNKTINQLSFPLFPLFLFPFPYTFFIPPKRYENRNFGLGVF
jgi:hypothetical protein